MNRETYEKRVNNKEFWYSNCLVEAIRAKLLYGKEVKLVVIEPRKNDVFCPHFMWYDKKDKLIKDFHGGAGFVEHWWEEYVFKGYIRCRPIETFNKWYAQAYGKEFAV